MALADEGKEMAAVLGPERGRSGEGERRGWPRPGAEGTRAWPGPGAEGTAGSPSEGTAGTAGLRLCSLPSSKPSWADQVEEEGGEDGE